MKVVLSLLAVLFSAGFLFGAGLTSVEIDGNTFTNITKVYPSANGRIIILFDGGGTSAAADKLPADFLASWLSADTLAGAKASQTATAEANLDRAIRTGRFREVAGVVYDTRRGPSGFVTFQNVKVIQVLDDGAIIDTVPQDVYTDIPIFVRHLPPVGDTDFLSFIVRPDGTYSYVNKNGDDRTIRAYDYGKICARDDIPETVLNGKKAFEETTLTHAPQKDVYATLPDSDDLVKSGSGFFVSKDGYLVTNHHVVKGARRIQVKTVAGAFPATVVRVDTVNDLALLKVAGDFQPLALATNDVQLGDAVFTIGFPDVGLQGTQPKYTTGAISSLSGIRDDPTEYQISVQVQPGNSGGPLVNQAGNVAGVIVARLDDFAALRSMGSLPQNVNFAVKGGLLHDFLAAGHEVNLNQFGPAIAPGATVATVQKSVALVLVY